MKTTTVIHPPGDKSLTHRALLLAALSEGECVIEHALTSLDARSMAGALRRMGIAISPLRGNVHVMGKGLRGLSPPDRALHCGNSGTSARLLLGVLAGVPIRATVTGDASLRRRPMRRVTMPLERMGARFVELDGDGLPIEVHGGPLQTITYRSPRASAQVKSAVLMAGLVAGVSVSVVEPVKSRDHTERMLRALGVGVVANGTAVRLTPIDAIPPFHIRIPGDPSSAAFLVCATLLAGGDETELCEVGVNPTRTGFLTVLRRMGAGIAIKNVREYLGEPVGDVVTRPSRLRATDVEPEEVPALIDEIPVLAIVASAAQGVSTFRGLAELRVKESNRLQLLASNLQAVGVPCEVAGDALRVEGRRDPPVGRVDTGRDHRMAMAFAVMGRRPGAAVRLSETASPDVSYPGFFADLEQVAPNG